jgi:uncharacterized lipoprotein NlpE involved in copper resistance
MKKIVILIFLLLILSGCSNNSEQFFGTYVFEEVSYLSPLSSSTEDYIKEQMSGVEYTISQDLFKIQYDENTMEIISPNYVRESIPQETTVLSNIHSFIGNEVKYQYTILDKDESKTHLRLYISSDYTWVASYADNTADGSEIIMHIYKLSK